MWNVPKQNKSPCSTNWAGHFDQLVRDLEAEIALLGDDQDEEEETRDNIQEQLEQMKQKLKAKEKFWKDFWKSKILQE